MQNSSLTWPSSRIKYYNPTAKIRSLIQNLDAELMQLCNQCSIPKPSIRMCSTYSSNKNENHRKPTTTMLGTNASVNQSNGHTDGSQVHSLARVYRSRVIEAYRSRRIFTVYGNYNTIRRALLHRGWLEKIAPGRYAKLQNLSEEVLLTHARRGNEYEAVAISKIINQFPAFFIWQGKGQRDLCGDVLPHRNRVRRGRNLDFSTKVGLIGCAEQQQWYSQDGICAMSYPRFYRLGGSFEERMAFIDDFRRTQCISLFRYITENIKKPDDLVHEEDGTVPMSIVDFALLQLRKHLNDMEHNTLDDDADISNVDNEKILWLDFISHSSEILKKKAKFKVSVKEFEETEPILRGILHRIEEKRPSYKWDGYRNLWILKPGYQCRGIGIVIRNSLDDILQWISNNHNRSYIAQKYIERPLLVYKTKFDIRQYMLLSIGQSTVSIWLYKDCYLRFSSQEFSIEDLRESIHLTNNSVQKKYKNKQTRDIRLPKNNMWSLDQFKLYLKNQNTPEEIWESKIFAGFKENLISVVMASLEETEFIQNAFELYGCDFMLDEEYNPILIEINSTPDLSPSTEVTAKICPLALRDLVKVIVDLPQNTRAATGLFQLVYEVNYKIKKDFDPQTGLDVSGKAMTLLKPPTSTYTPNFLKKPIKLVKKAENVMKKIPRKKLKDKNTEKITMVKEKSSQGLSISSKTRSLKSFTKEALALQYTAPK